MSKPFRISPAEALDMMTNEDVPYIDVRTEDEFAEGHPEGAFNVPFLLLATGGMEPNSEFLRVVARRFSKDFPVIVGCKVGGRSARAAQALAEAGFAHVFDQSAGWDGSRGPFGELTAPGWSRLSLPREEGLPEGRCYEALRST